MSYASDKGYVAEHAIETLLQSWGDGCAYRPRAGRRDDLGDIGGVPMVFSVKAHARLDLAGFITDLQRMVRASGLDSGVVWHKRRGTTDPCLWYVTTTGSLFRPMYEAFCEVRRS